MTLLLVRVADAGEAAVATAAGVDIVELRLPAFDEAHRTEVRAVRRAFAGTLRLSLDGLAFSHDLVQGALSLGADELAMAIDASPASIPVVDAQRPTKLAAVALLGIAPDTADAIQRVRRRVEKVMIEAGRATRLFDRAGIAQLSALADACRASGLPFGFSGGLEPPDIARLLLLRPDVLGFDVAVRSNHQPDGRLLPHLVEAVRAMIPREKPADTSPVAVKVRDTIVVRDFVVPISIGAYRAEEVARQRVRFFVEAEVERHAGPPRDMRDVFSYDVVLETIRVMADRPHVAFVETLAEEVAATVLKHAEVVSVRVGVEKLDVIDGAVGITITRTRPA